jgi:hypothetical protein
MNTAKKLSLQIVLLLSGTAALTTATQAQGIGGIFNQNEEQKEYLLQQITALQVYDGYLQKGYSIAKDGTGAISTIKNNDFSLHTGHFDSLKIVSNSVRNYSKVKGITQLQQQIITGHNKTYPQLIQSNQINAAELTNFNNIYQAIMQQSKADLEELQLVITNGKLQMTDNERIARIDKLYKEMQDLYGKEQQLNNQALALAAQRRRGSKDNQILKSLYQ